MDRTLRGVVYARCYIDVIIMWSENVYLHMRHVRAILKLLKGLRVHPGKCVLYHRFPGVQVDGEGVEAPLGQDQGYPGDANVKGRALSTRSPRVVLLLEEVCGALHRSTAECSVEGGCEVGMGGKSRVSLFKAKGGVVR